MALTVAMALCELETERWKTDDLFKLQNTALPTALKSSSTLSLASSTGASSYYSVESGISSMSPDCLAYQTLESYQELAKTNFYQCDFLTENPEESQAIYENLQTIIAKLKENGDGSDAKILLSAEGHETSKWSSTVIYEGRNLLDLGDNLRNDKAHWVFQFAQLPEGNRDRFYFDNRSQYSRVRDAYPPPECVHRTCTLDQDCGFVLSIYT